MEYSVHPQLRALTASKDSAHQGNAMVKITLAEVTGVSGGNWGLQLTSVLTSYLEVPVANFPLETDIWILRISHAGLRAELWRPSQNSQVFPVENKTC